MKREIIFRMKSPYRDEFRIQGFRFDSGEKSLAIVGSMRGDEIQQQYICSQIVKRLSELEQENRLIEGHEILVIPSVNPFSMNIEKRFWALDNTDINRMFPGYDQGETTQRIASALFKALEGYAYGVQMASFYIPGEFIPHVRMIETNYEDTYAANLFGLPYVCIRKPTPFDTTLLNYNWQLWETRAFSIYGGQTSHVENNTSNETISALLRFMNAIHLIDCKNSKPGYNSQLIHEEDLVTVKTEAAGILYRLKHAHDEIRKGDVLAHIINPYDGSILCKVTSPVDGVIFFAHNKPLAIQDAPLYKIHAS